MFQLPLLSQQQNAAIVRTCFCLAAAAAAAQLVSVEVCATFTLAQAQRAPERTDAPVFLILNASSAPA